MNKGKLNITATDEFGRKMKLKRSYDLDECDDFGTIDWFIEQFKDFLHCYGFSDSQTEYLVYLDHGEKVVYEGQTIIERPKM